MASVAIAGTFLAAPVDAQSTDPNRAPVIWGTPSTTAQRGTLYTFRPHASDRDGNRLRFSIVNKPKWMWFDRRTGTLKGMPKWAQRNRTFSGITIRVSDGRLTDTLPAFSIRVGAIAANSRPVISGTPPRTAVPGQAYSFRPRASDADGDRLTFSIDGKPAWARFAPGTGALSGRPTRGDVGTYSNIVIRAWDGRSSASLGPFSIQVAAGTTATDVTLSWIRPNRNEDGTWLDDLAQYRVFYGTASRRYSTTITVPASTTSVVVEDLPAGTWYFAIKSVNTDGVASDYSEEVSVVL